ncbi:MULTISPECIES: hypothetical protein [unclassified Brevundimonas]|uniref:hypothetical protein n=1 Tax=unclassified Brevundimonas TaxID=2622653 RepID=UPI003F8DE383
MSQPLSSTARWIVVPTFRNDIAWRAAVVAAAAEAGLRLHDLDAFPQDAPLSDPGTVILTADAQRAVEAGVTALHLAGLIAAPGMRLSDADDPDAPPPHIAVLTDLMARTALLPPDRLFRSADFDAGPVEVLPGVKVHRPAPAPTDTPLSPRLRAVTEAVALLDPARPQAVWAPELFNYDSRTVPGGARGQLDLTGRPRFMITGPYITLPPGRWRATYRLTFDAKGSRPRFRVDWGSQTDFISKEFTPGRAGVFEIVQEYDWTERAPCELRIIVLEGVFDGRMTFSGAQISRVG